MMRIMPKIRRKSKVRKLIERTGSFDIVLPCLRDAYICEITPVNNKALAKTDVPDNIKVWFKDNEHELFDEETFFDFLETDLDISLSQDLKKTLLKYVTIKNETITIRRMKMLELLETKHYPSELSSFVQVASGMAEQPSKDNEKDFAQKNAETAQMFHRWVACTCAIEPKILSLHHVKLIFKGETVPEISYWFHPSDLTKIQLLAEKYRDKTITETMIRLLPEFNEDWDRNDLSKPNEKVPIWWVEDIGSDADLVYLSNTAFNGPNPKERPDLKPFSE
jgi:hypothetical protein